MRQKTCLYPDSINIMLYHLGQVISCLILSTYKMRDNNICLYLLTTKIVTVKQSYGRKILYTCIKFQLFYPKEKNLLKKGMTWLVCWPWIGQSGIKKCMAFKMRQYRFHHVLHLWAWTKLCKLSNLKFPHYEIWTS